jgi:PST family polysaccharide transporter
MIVLLLFPITRFGVYDYLIQHESLDEPTKTAGLAVSFMLGSALFATVYWTAPLISAVLQDQALVPALRIIAIIFLFAPIGTVQEAILAKQFKFKLITRCQIAGIVPSGFIGVGLAFLEFGTLSIVLQQVSSVVLTSLLMWFAEPWRPRLDGSGVKFTPMLRMGVSYTGGQLLSSINTNLFGLAVAAVGGTDAAGLFRVAWAGFMLCMQLTVLSFANVVQPVFSSLRQDTEKLRSSFLAILRYFSALTFGAFAMVGAAAPELVEFAFGDRWRAAAEPLSIMTLFIVAGAPNYLLRSYLNAIGVRTNKQRWPQQRLW